MFDPLQRMQHVEEFDAEIAAILREIRSLPRGARVRHGRDPLARRRVDMVDGAQRGGGAPDGTAGVAQAGERLRARIFVEHGAIDVEQDLPALRIETTDGMRVDELVVEGAGAVQDVSFGAFAAWTADGPFDAFHRVISMV